MTLMPSPYRALPPLNVLRTFEAVARNAGFTRAGSELGLTQSAVSRQIGQLELDLGARLFTRGPTGVALTSEGRTLLDGVRAGLDSVLLASERVRAGRRAGVLAVGAPAAFAAWWLVPRLGRFAMRAPDVEVRLAVVDAEPDLDRLGLDIAFVLRPSPAPRRDDEMWLLREAVFPVCSPAFRQRHELHGPSDLTACRLIECDGAEAPEFGWRAWLARFGLSEAQVPWARFGDPGLALTAAIDGQGVALGRSPMIDAELAAGRLVRPFAEHLSARPEHLYALKWRQPLAQSALAFRDFALDEACGCELAAGPCGMPPSEQDTAAVADLGGRRAALRVLTV